MSDSSQNKKLGKAEAEAEKAKAKAMRPWFKKKRFIIPIALVLLIFIAGFFGGEESDSPGVQVPETSLTETESPEPVEIQEPELTETLGQKNARQSAESYLNFKAFSREGLIEQLEFEDYSTEDATYGVDALDANWREQAAKSAEAYLDFKAFSKQGLIDQLMFEGYSKAEAEFGVTAVGY